MTVSLPRRLVPLAIRIASTLAGAGIIYHEVVVTETAEPLLVFVGLWLSGAPIADFLDKLRRLASASQDVVEAPEAPESPEIPPSLRRRRGET
jgi:hypothetical protein